MINYPGNFFFLFFLVGFLTSSSTSRLYGGPVSANHSILTPTQPVGSGRPQRESNPGPPLPTELPPPPPYPGNQIGVWILIE